MIIRNNDYKYFNKARQAATISDYYKTHIGCIAVYQGHKITIPLSANNVKIYSVPLLNVEKEEQYDKRSLLYVMQK